MQTRRDFADAVGRRRSDRKITQQALERATTVSQKQISNIENAATNPRLDTVPELAHGPEASLELVPFDHLVIPRVIWDEMVWRDEHQLDDES